MSIRVVKPGLLTTVQDRGRYGFAHLGISPCGAADAVSLRIANRLVGNDDDAAALEMTLAGASLQFVERTEIAVAGADCHCKLNSYRIAALAAQRVDAGSVLECGNITGGARTYLALRGGIDMAAVMGSRSTDLRGEFGGYEGRALKAGDVFPLGGRTAGRSRRLRKSVFSELVSNGPIRVTRGVQADWFVPEQFDKFLGSTYTVSEQSDRAGLRLLGEAIPTREARQLLTDGIPLGAIQITQAGQPIVLFVDQQTTGGYPKIANVIAADMHRVGQLRPRDEVRFHEVSLDEAVQALRWQEDWLRRIWEE